MRTVDERTQRVMKRANALRRRSNRRITTALTGASVCLVVILGFLIVTLDGSHAFDSTGLAGAMLLPEGAGGYVLIAVVAFAAAVVLTAVLMRRREQPGQGMSHFWDESSDEEDTK